jgi:uncharacterized protein (UPF0297 family)
MVEKAIAAVVDAMKAQPLVLAMLVIYVVSLGATIYIILEVANAARVREERRDVMLSEITKSCLNRESSNASDDPSHR